MTDPELDDVITRMLASNPAGRIALHDKLASLLRSLKDAQETAVQRALATGNVDTFHTAHRLNTSVLVVTQLMSDFFRGNPDGH